MKVAVGSKNPLKIAIVKEAFELIYPDKHLDVVGVEISSGVSDEPMSDEESIKGARNRAKRSLALSGGAYYGVGLENGLQQTEGQWFETGWVVIINKNGVENLGSSIRMLVPPKVLVLVQQGVELGKATDKIFKVENSGQNDGFFGAMTKNTITRKSACIHAVLCALTRFIHPDLF